MKFTIVFLHNYLMSNLTKDFENDDRLSIYSQIVNPLV